MSYSPAVRDRARSLYVQEGWPFRQIAEETGVAKSTLVRWSQREDWDELREMEAEVKLGARKLLLRALEDAATDTDPQQVYAAAQAAKLVGLLSSSKQPPSPKAIAVLLLDQLGKHPVVGPVVRRHRNEVIRLVLAEVERMEPEAGGEA